MKKLVGTKGRLDCPACAAGIDLPAGEPVLPPLQ